jgi:UDP-galactose transporter B1
MLCAVGIFSFYFLFGILQERITRGKYGEEEERFTFSLALVFCLCIGNYLYAKIMAGFSTSSGQDSTPMTYYALSAFTYLTAMVSSNKALLWVNYPTQVIGKSCKPIPVMLLGVLFGGKKYPLLKYLPVLLIVSGVALFMYKPKSGASDNVNSNLIGSGELLLMLSLLCDGLTGAVQERMKSEHQTKSAPMMINMNFWSVIFLGTALVLTGELWEFYQFSFIKHPGILLEIPLLALASALGQYFIFMCVSDFGPLPCSIITTTRKFFTVLFSVIIFGTILAGHQWIGVVLVFSGLFLDAKFGKGRSEKPPTQKP